MIGEIFYTLFIWPISFILEFLFVLFIRIFDAPGPAVIFLSVVVCTLSLPIYLVADRWQKEERDLQKRMKKKLDSIKSVFKGDEKQMIINAYYRQMGYSPFFILKASVGILLQIPFFIAAYQFLTRTKLLTGISFLFIKDLNAPDALLALPVTILGISALNIMPFLMTTVNLASAIIYSKDLGKRETIQLFAMAIIFLVLLYNSPSGLVLYWTMNNIYSLLKNASQAYLKKPGRVLQITSLAIAAVFAYLIWSGEARVERYNALFGGIAALLAVVPFIWQPLIKMLSKNKKEGEIDEKITKETDILFFSAAALLFLLLGFLNPAQILSSSVSDFENPWYFFFITALQSFSFLVLIPVFIRALCSSQIRRGLAVFWSMLLLICLLCYFALSASYGVMDRNFKLDNTDRLLHAFPVWISILLPLTAIIFIAFFVFFRKEKILAILFQAGCAAILVLTCIDLVSLGKGYSELSKLKANEEYSKDELPVYFQLSQKEKNVFIVFLDRAQGSAMSDALEYMPSLKTEFDGFIFYPNTLSFGSNTVTGVPAMLGGYNYTPQAINKRKDELLVKKVNSAITNMPRFFGEAGYKVTITDPVIANMQSVPDISIFNDLPNVSAKLLSGKLTDHYRREFPDSVDDGINTFDFDILFRYGIFRAAPPILRYGIYYKGQWWREAAYNSYGRAIGEFSSLYYLPGICSINNNNPSLNILMNSITHENGYYNDNFFPQETPVIYNNSNAEYLNILVSAMKQLSKWFDYLKENEIYDNTRIIIVSDHGGNYRSRLCNSEMESYNPILIIKDFYSNGKMKISDNFMTHADTPYLAAADLNLSNMDKIDIKKEKEGEIAAVSSVSSQPLRHGPYQFNLNRIRELKGRDVMKKESWGEWKDY